MSAAPDDPSPYRSPKEGGFERRRSRAKVALNRRELQRVFQGVDPKPKDAARRCAAAGAPLMSQVEPLGVAP